MFFPFQMIVGLIFSAGCCRFVRSSVQCHNAYRAGPRRHLRLIAYRFCFEKAIQQTKTWIKMAAEVKKQSTGTSLFERPKSASDSIAVTKDWLEEPMASRRVEASTKSQTLQNYQHILMFLTRNRCCISSFLHFCLSACSLMFACIIS